MGPLEEGSDYIKYCINFINSIEYTDCGSQIEYASYAFSDMLLKDLHEYVIIFPG